MDSTSGADGPESEEDYFGENPYPLEGKYIDEFDRQRYTATLALCFSSTTEDLTGSPKCPKLSAKRSSRNALRNFSA